MIRQINSTIASNGGIEAENNLKYPFLFYFYVNTKQATKIASIHDNNTVHLVYSYYTSDENHALLIDGGGAKLWLKDVNNLEKYVFEHRDRLNVGHRNELNLIHKLQAYSTGLCIVSRIGLPYSEVYDWLYPNIDIKLLGQEYLASNAPLLFLIGEPGTGKSSFLKIMKQHFGKEIILADKEHILHQEFSHILSKCNDKIIVFDDITEPLSQRTDIVDALCQYSSGLHGVSPKIIITSNIQKSQINEALIRSGRCFDVVSLLPLSAEEANGLWQLKCGFQDRPFIGTITQSTFMEEVTLRKNGTTARRYYLKKEEMRGMKIGF